MEKKLKLTLSTHYKPHRADKLMSYFVQLQDESYRALLDMLVLDLPKPRRVSTPLLVLGGTDDNIFRPYEIVATAKAYRTEAVIFPNMAHDLMLDPGWQTVADRIMGWLSERMF